MIRMAWGRWFKTLAKDVLVYGSFDRKFTNDEKTGPDRPVRSGSNRCDVSIV